MATEPRTFHLLDPAPTGEQAEYASNTIKTTKYNLYPWSLDFFLYKMLWEQFQRKANIYFLVVGCLQLVPGLSPTGRYTTIATLCFVLLFSAIKSAVEDIGRFRKDREINYRKAYVLVDEQSTEWKEVHYTDIRVGQIIRVENVADDKGARRNDFPCDICLLSTSDPEGIAYVETANLDGETNLKAKRCLDDTRFADETPEADIPRLAAQKYCGLEMQSEQPNGSLYTFTGTLNLPSAPKPLTITPDQMLYRGCLLRKVHWIIGVVVFTGLETKIMMNARKPPHKASAVERLVNKLLIVVLSLQLILCASGAIGLYFSETTGWFYLGPSDKYSRSQEAGLGFLTFIILLNNFIPISLYVSIEFVKFFQGRMLEQDLCMYYDPKDMPASAKTTDLNEELGQVSYVFSDKTGTLTRNVMTFLKFCMPDGTSYGRGTTEIGRAAAKRVGKEVHDPRTPEQIESENPFWDERINEGRWMHLPEADAIRALFEVLAVCHTVVVDSGKYEAESPDEEALVKAARLFGYTFVTRSSNNVIVETANGAHRTYVILDVIEFNSDRKRMSVVVKCPDDTVRIMMKGADTAVFKRLADGYDIAKTEAALSSFGEEGLRTLVLASRVMDETEWRPWVERNHAARAIIGDEKRKAQLLAEYAAEIERDMHLVGSTAIEDKLQEGVPATIAALRSAGMKVWMLTGDKMETAINIGFACALLHDTMHRVILSTDYTPEELLSVMEKNTDVDPSVDVGAIIDGETLGKVFFDLSLRTAFVNLTSRCSSVVCCRVSPQQKADVVDMVRENRPDAVTLSIGDGANDVPMIQAAHVGIGISGMEGQQAANSADYAIGQFRYLHRLTLIHGRANYQRLCLLIRYFFYKNAVVVLTQFWYCIFNRWTGQSLYEQWTLAGYNVFFTSLPIVIVGIFDRDILNTDNVHMLPKLYQAGLNNEALNLKVFAQWLFTAVVHSIAIFFIVMFGWGTATGKNGVNLGLDGVGVTMYCAVIITVNLKLALHTQSFSWMHYLGFGISILGFFMFLATYGALPPSFSTVGYAQLVNIGFQVSPWLFFFISVSISLSRDFLWRFVEYNWIPIKDLPLVILAQLKDSLDPTSSVRMPLELRQERQHTMKDVVGGSAAIQRLFADHTGDDVVLDPSQDLFFQFINQELEDEFIDQHIGNLSRYKIGIGMTALGSLVIVLNFGSQYPSNSTSLEVGTWTLFSFAAWFCFLLLLCAGVALKPYLHTLMTLLLTIGFSGMTIANLVRADIDTDTHPVTLGVVLLGLMLVVRPPVLHGLHYIIISFLCYLIWYQAFRVTLWQVKDFFVRFVEIVIVAITAFISLCVSESFLRRMFVAQKQVAMTAKAAQAEERRSLMLLGNVLPQALVTDLRVNKQRQLSDFSVTYNSASLLNSDIVKFTNFSSTKEPHTVVEMLNKMFTKFDNNATILGLEKIKTIGDAYICAAGIPIPDLNHRRKIIVMCLSMIEAIKELNDEGISSIPVLDIQIRVGCATGPVQAGVIAMQKVAYDVFGHVAEESELMEQTGLPSRVHVSKRLREEVGDMFRFEEIKDSEGVINYFVIPPLVPIPLVTDSSSAGGAVVTNELHRDDVYKLLEDEDEFRREIIKRYSDFDGKLSPVTLNFENERAEQEFRHHLRALASTRFPVEVSQGVFLFAIVWLLVYLAITYPFKNYVIWLLIAAAVIHLVALIVYLVQHRNDADKPKTPPSANGRPSNNNGSDLDTERAADAGEIAPDEELPMCSPLRFWALLSAICSYAMPIIVMIGAIVHGTGGSPTMTVFIVLGSNIYVLGLLHVRLWAKIVISVLHFGAVVGVYVYTGHNTSGHTWSLSADGGNLLAIFLCYLLCVVSAYTIEDSVRSNFAAAKRVVYQNAEVMAAVDLCDKLLNNVLPRSIVSRLKSTPDKAIVDEVPEASVLFVYTKGLKHDSVEGKSTVEIVEDMNTFLYILDSLCMHHRVEKIKTTPFLIVSGCPEPCKDHARRLALLARDIAISTEEYNHRTGSHIKVRFGMHTGKVTAGVLGTSKFIYDIFGDTVNLASRLTSSANWGELQMSEVSSQAISHELGTRDKGIIELKGKGPVHIFTLDMEDQRLKDIPTPHFWRERRPGSPRSPRSALHKSATSVDMDGSVSGAGKIKVTEHPLDLDAHEGTEEH